MIILQGGGPVFAAYHSYLVRFWQSNEQGHWRASAQCVQMGNTVRFGDVASLLAFLQTEIKVKPAQGAAGSSAAPVAPI